MRALCTALALVSSPVMAQDVAPCDWQARADAIVEPWSENTRTFSNGEVRVALLDVIEPALGSYYLLVMSPPYDEVGGRQCQVVGFDGGVGFTWLDFASLTADYSPERGLELQMLGRIAAPEYDFTNPVNLWVTINQSSGEITTFMELGPE